MERFIENECHDKEKEFTEAERKRTYREQMKEYDSLIKEKYHPVVSSK